MRFIAVPIIVATAATITNFSGCKSETDPAATGAAVEELNDTLGRNWTEFEKGRMCC
jgi:hypothetical protein